MTLNDKKIILTFRLLKSAVNMLCLMVAAFITIGFLYVGHIILLFAFLGALACIYIILGWQYCRFKDIVVTNMSDQERRAWSDNQVMRDQYIQRWVVVALVLSVFAVVVIFGTALVLPHIY